MKTIDVIIIGAGPAGLFAGTQIKNKSVILFDHQKNCSLKLLMSGAGQCNFTHTGDVKDFLEKYNGHKAFLKTAFRQFFNEDSKSYFENAGVEVMTRDDGKVFPKSLSAEDVKRALVNENSRLGHKIQTGETVKTIQVLEDGFQVITDKEQYHATYLLGAFGGCSYPTTGSDGQLFKVFKNMGHSIVPLKPSLAPVYVEKESLLELQGVSFRNCHVRNYRDNNPVGTYTGDLLITHFGVSGPVVLNNSRTFMPGDVLRLQFGERSKKELDRYLVEKGNVAGKQEIGTVLRGLDYPKRLIEFVLATLKIKKELKMSELSKQQRQSILEKLCAYPLEIHHVGGYNVAMATTGGIDLQEVNRKTMESKVIDGLYFAGECMDVDGDTGGYNIQWAMTSGYIAGVSIDKTSQ